MKDALLVARIGPTRDVELVAVTEYLRAALVYTADTCPDLIIVTQDTLNNRSADRLIKLRSQCVHTPILVLADNAAAVPDMPEGLIDIVLQTGIQSSEISRTIEALLETQQRTP